MTEETIQLEDVAACVAAGRNPSLKGPYRVQLGNTTDQIYSAVGWTAPPGDHFTSADVSRVGTFPTTLQHLTLSQFEHIQRHGFEVADATLITRLTSSFVHRKFAP